MDSQRNFFLILFLVSLAMLWLNWSTYQHRKNAPLAARPSVSQNATPNDMVRLPEHSQVFQSPANPSMAGQPNLPTSPNAPNAPINSIAPHNANTLNTNDEAVVVDTPLFRATFSPLGGHLIRMVLTQHKNDEGQGELTLMDRAGPFGYYAQVGIFAGQDKVPNALSRFEFDQKSYQFDAGKTEWVVRATAIEDGVRVVKSWVFHPNRYDIEVRQVVANERVTPINVSPFYLLLHNNRTPEGSNWAYTTFQGPAYYTQSLKYNKVHWKDIDKKPSEFQFVDNNGWMGMVQHYFVSAWILPKDTQRQFFINPESTPGLYSAGLLAQSMTVNPGQSQEFVAQLYAGPQDQDTLEVLAEGLDLVVDYGLLTVIAKPLFLLMQWIYSWVGNWGWTIVVLTIIIKSAFFPLSAASYKSMAKMRKLTPKMTALREKFANDKQKQQMELIKLYQTEKVNPLGGCLPIFVQIPVFIALYWVLLGSVEMRSAQWLGWIVDLSKPDPYFILPIIYAATMYVQMQLNPPPPDPLQAKMMKILPMVFSIFFFFFPAGLVLYWIVNNVLSIAQQYYSIKKYA